jgi:RNA recognition motif-containing protein
MGGRILQVSNISKEARRSDIKELFSQYGYILDCYMGRRDCTIVSFGLEGR